MARVRLAPAAKEDLRAIRIYSKTTFGAAVAAEYMEGLRTVFRLLRDQPQAGRADDDLLEGIRSFAHKSHRIYYRLDVEGVNIIRILHHARHAPDALGEIG